MTTLIFADDNKDFARLDLDSSPISWTILFAASSAFNVDSDPIKTNDVAGEIKLSGFNTLTNLSFDITLGYGSREVKPLNGWYDLNCELGTITPLNIADIPTSEITLAYAPYNDPFKLAWAIKSSETLPTTTIVLPFFDNTTEGIAIECGFSELISVVAAILKAFTIPRIEDFSPAIIFAPAITKNIK